MGAAEVIAKAIEKLERLRNGATPEPWISSDGGTKVLGKYLGVERTVADWVPFDYDDELIVTLHRTIDAQLAILERAWSFIHVNNDDPTALDDMGCPGVLALASAILGES